MENFKVGDKIKWINDNNRPPVSASNPEYLFEIGCVHDTQFYLIKNKQTEGGNKCYEHGTNWVQELSNAHQNVEIVKSTNLITNMKTLFELLVDVDTRTLREAEFLNGDLALTTEGQAELMNLIFLDKKAELVKIAQTKLDEIKAKK